MVPEVALRIAWKPCAKSRGRLGSSSPSSQSGSTKCNFGARPSVLLLSPFSALTSSQCSTEPEHLTAPELWPWHRFNQ